MARFGIDGVAGVLAELRNVQEKYSSPCFCRGNGVFDLRLRAAFFFHPFCYSSSLPSRFCRGKGVFDLRLHAAFFFRPFCYSSSLPSRNSHPGSQSRHFSPVHYDACLAFYRGKSSIFPRRLASKYVELLDGHSLLL